jgi:hypothetical protein
LLRNPDIQAVRTPAVANTNGFSCVLSAADELGWTDSVSLALETDGTTPIDDSATPTRTRFFRLVVMPDE